MKKLIEVVNNQDYYERKRDSEYNLINYNLTGKVYNFGIADINYKSPKSLIKQLITRAEKGTYSYSYTPKLILEAVKNWYNYQHKIVIKNEWIKIVHGTINAMYQTVQAFTNEKDYILIQTPIYQPFADAIIFNNRQIIENKLLYDQQNKTYKINFINFEKLIVEKNIKLFILCSPHNPGAVVWDYDTIAKIVEICQKHKVLIFSDEVHSDIVFKSFTSILKFNYDNVILANSPNKAFNLGGLKASYLIIKNKNLKKIIDQQYQKNYVTSTNVFVNYAFQAVYLNEYSKLWLEELKATIWENYQYIKTELEKLKMQVFKLEATYLIWVEVPDLYPVKFLEAELKKHNIIICSYKDFYKAKNNYIRINIATDKFDLKYLINALKQILKQK